METQEQEISKQLLEMRDCMSVHSTVPKVLVEMNAYYKTKMEQLEARLIELENSQSCCSCVKN